MLSKKSRQFALYCLNKISKKTNITDEHEVMFIRALKTIIKKRKVKDFQIDEDTIVFIIQSILNDYEISIVHKKWKMYKHTYREVI